MKVDQLEGHALAEWVARVLGWDVRRNEYGYCVLYPSPANPFAGYISDCNLKPQFEPHKDWKHGGPVVDRLMASGHWQIEPIHWLKPESYPDLKMRMVNYENVRDESEPLGGHSMPQASFDGPTVLIVACRALVFSVYGAEVPDSALTDPAAPRDPPG